LGEAVGVVTPTLDNRRMDVTEQKPIEPTPSVGTKWRRSPCRASGGDERSKELADRIRECSRSISSLQRDLLADVAEFDQSEAWRGDGAVSMTAWLTERCAVSGATARVWTQTAIKLESLPRLADALAGGALSLDVLSPLARVATPDTDKDLATKRRTGASSKCESWRHRARTPRMRRRLAIPSTVRCV
jgi:hypothetical protein